MDVVNLKEKREIAREIAMQCLKLNDLGEQRKFGGQRNKGDKPAVWFFLSGHTGSIEVQVAERGWFEYCENDYNKVLYDWTDLSEYHNCLDYLKSLEVDIC